MGLTPYAEGFCLGIALMSFAILVIWQPRVEAALLRLIRRVF